MQKHLRITIEADELEAIEAAAKRAKRPVIEWVAQVLKQACEARDDGLPGDGSIDAVDRALDALENKLGPNR